MSRPLTPFERGHAAAEVREHRNRREHGRVSPVYEYEPCPRCNPETRTVRSHGQPMLCPDCGGQGWAQAIVVGWRYADE